MKHDRAFVRGVGQTPYVREATQSAESLAADAVAAACADAGIAPTDIDGFVGYPGHPSAEWAISEMAIPSVRFRASTTIGGAAAVSGLGMAALAVSAGAARNVLLLRSTRAGTGKRKEKAADELPGGEIRRQLEWPIGWNSAAQRYSLLCRRFMHEFGLRREHLAEIALAARRHAQLNPAAQLFGKPLSLDQYMDGDIVADPFWRHDCCLRTDGACAVIVSADDRGDRRAVRILASADAAPAVPDDLTSRPHFLETGLEHAAPIAWNDAGLGPGDMDAAMIYDCFTFEVAHQLAAAGFVSPGNVGDFIAAGSIRLGSRLPVNTGGGLLAEGNMSGLSHVIEAVRQLRHEGGARQVAGARHIAAIGWGNLGDGSIAVLGTNDG